MGLPIHTEDSHNGFNHEYFYICNPANEGESLVLPGVSGTSRTKAYSIGMVYDYPMEREFRLRFRNDKNKNEEPALVTYGISPTRAVHCILHAHHDDRGFDLPATVRPFDAVIIPSNEEALENAQTLYSKIRADMLRATGGNINAMEHVALDDRIRTPIAERQKFAEYIGTPLTVVVGRNGYEMTARDGQKLSSTPEQDTAARAIIGLSALTRPL